MQKKCRKKVWSFILCIVLIVATALFTSGCNGKTENNTSASHTAESVQTESTELGEGSTSFYFSVVDKNGNETQFYIHTDKEKVGEALTEVGLIDGEESEYGLYVTKVNGIAADYEKDGLYWAFYINGEYAVSGVDSTPITEGEIYSFKME